jgi:hypothetical protein
LCKATIFTFPLQIKHFIHCPRFLSLCIKITFFWSKVGWLNVMVWRGVCRPCLPRVLCLGLLDSWTAAGARLVICLCPHVVGVVLGFSIARVPHWKCGRLHPAVLWRLQPAQAAFPFCPLLYPSYVSFLFWPAIIHGSVQIKQYPWASWDYH